MDMGLELMEVVHDVEIGQVQLVLPSGRHNLPSLDTLREMVTSFTCAKFWAAYMPLGANSILKAGTIFSTEPQNAYYTIPEAKSLSKCIVAEHFTIFFCVHDLASHEMPARLHQQSRHGGGASQAWLIDS
jgi:hypothetical protein